MVAPSVEEHGVALLSDHIHVMLVDLALQKIAQHLGCLHDLVTAGWSARSSDVVLTDVAVGCADGEHSTHGVCDALG